MLLKRLFDTWKKLTHLSHRPVRRKGHRGWIPTEALEQRVVMAADTTQTLSVSGINSGGGQLCNDVFTVQVQTDGVLKVEYIASAGHCSSVIMHFQVDGVQMAVSGALKAGQSTGTIDLGPVSPGTHSVGLQAEGVRGGCNRGSLYSWAGSLNVTTTTTPIPDITLSNGRIEFQGRSKSIQYDWRFDGLLAPRTFTVALYRSADATWDSTDVPMGSPKKISANKSHKEGTARFGLSNNQTPDQNRPFFVIVADPNNVVKEASDQNNQTSAAYPTIEVLTDRSAELMQFADFTVLVHPAIEVEDYRIELRWKKGNTDWIKIVHSNLPEMTWTPRIAGDFEVRAVVTINGVELASNDLSTKKPPALRVTFPSIDVILNRPEVMLETEFLWQQTLAFASNGPTKREFGTHIILNTADDIYTDSGTSEGAPVPHNAIAKVVPHKPHDTLNIVDWNPTASYVVAAIHTHPPLTYATTLSYLLGKTPGASGGDISKAIGERLPGITVDYVGKPNLLGQLAVLPGHSLSDPKDLYPFGPLTRGYYTLPGGRNVNF